MLTNCEDKSLGAISDGQLVKANVTTPGSSPLNAHASSFLLKSLPVDLTVTTTPYNAQLQDLHRTHTPEGLDSTDTIANTHVGSNIQDHD